MISDKSKLPLLEMVELTAHTSYTLLSRQAYIYLYYLYKTKQNDLAFIFIYKPLGTSLVLSEYVDNR